MKIPILRTVSLSFMSRMNKFISPLLVMNCQKALQSSTFVPGLPFFLAKLQAIKTSHSSFIEIPRSLDRQYLPGKLHQMAATRLNPLWVLF
jgi:hypothetical protein